MSKENHTARRPRLQLDQLEVVEPCHESWHTMHPLEGGRRHCDSCSKAVIDLSTLSRTEAEEVIAKPGTPPCVRFARDANGRVMTREDFARQTRRSRRFAWLRSVASIAAALGFGSLFNLGCGERKSLGTPPVIGDVVAVPTTLPIGTVQGEPSMGIVPAMPSLPPSTQPSRQPTTQPQRTFLVGSIAPPKLPPPVTQGKMVPPKKKRPT